MISRRSPTWTTVDDVPPAGHSTVTVADDAPDSDSTFHAAF